MLCSAPTRRHPRLRLSIAWMETCAAARATVRFWMHSRPSAPLLARGRRKLRTEDAAKKSRTARSPHTRKPLNCRSLHSCCPRRLPPLPSSLWESCARGIAPRRWTLSLRSRTPLITPKSSLATQSSRSSANSAGRTGRFSSALLTLPSSTPSLSRPARSSLALRLLLTGCTKSFRTRWQTSQHQRRAPTRRSYSSSAGSRAHPSATLAASVATSPTRHPSPTSTLFSWRAVPR
mmetsp:Transcript_9523/g.19036  ORF Transcript_9523/g.19036 Transcript_9523/m.19036 type:complete len:234 (+) Transcript_9523:489-1190(+)